MRKFISLVVFLCLLTGTLYQPAASVTAQSGELLANPSFEEPYYRIATDEGGGAIAHDWKAWWYNDPGPDYSVPEYEIAPKWRDPYRVHTGEAAQQIFRPSVLWMAGVYQRVQVPANSQLRFTIWGHAWATFCKKVDGGHDCDYRDSNYGEGQNPGTLRIGIDPTGGENWGSADVVWSGNYNIHDNFEQLLVEATAQGEYVTVFTYTTFLYPAVVNNMYWDDASLIVIGQGEPPPDATDDPGSDDSPPPSGDGTIVTQTPGPDGSIVHIVQPGESLSLIAWAYGVSVPELRELNDLTKDTLVAGQKLIIRPPQASPTPTLEEVADASAEPTEAQPTQIPTDTPLPPPTPTPTTGKICLDLYEDQNQNGVREPGEPQIPGATLQLIETGSSMVTDGSGQALCITDLAPGTYTAVTVLPEGYRLTSGSTEVPFTIGAGSSGQIDFGVTPGVIQAPDNAEAVEESAQFNWMPIIAIGGVGLVLLLVGVGGVGFVLLRSRKQTDASEDDEIIAENTLEETSEPEESDMGDLPTI